MSRQLSLRALVLCQAALLLAMLLIPGLAAAATIQTDLFVYNNGDTVNVTGVDFGPDEVVDFVTTDPNGIVVDSGSAMSDAGGNVAYSFVLQATVDGIYDVVGTGETSGYSATTQFDPASITYTDLGASPIVKQNGQSITFAGQFTCVNGTPAQKCAAVTGITIGIYRTNGGNNVDTSAGNLVASFSPTTPASFPVSGTPGVTNAAWNVTKTIGTTLALPDGRYEVAVTMAFTDSGGNAQTAGPATNTGAADEFVVDNTAAGAPAGPIMTGSTPTSPSMNAGPSINGTVAEGGLTVRLYKQSDCSGPVQGAATYVAAAGSFSILVGVGNNSSTTFYGQSTDASNNVSPCSATSVTYVADNNPPTVVINTSPTNPTTSFTANFTFSPVDGGANASGVNEVECRLDSPTWGPCTTPTSFSGTVLGTGSHTFGVRATDSAGNVGNPGTTYTWTVNASNTPPTVVVTGVTDGSSYDTGSVPGATCQVTDLEDGNSSFAASLSAITGPYATDGIGSQTASCSYTDGGGLSDTDSATYSIVDPSAPSISYVLSPAAPNGNDGWYVSNVTLTWTVSDPQSPNSLAPTGCVNQSLTADQVATDYSCSASSAGGNAGPVTVTIKIDKTAPVITGATDRDPNVNGWYKADVTVSFACSDALSGTDTNTVSGDNQTLGEGANQHVTSDGDCTDMAGNVAATPVTVSGINIDETAPTNFVFSGGGLSNGGLYYYGFVPSGPTSCSADASISGPDGACGLSGYSTALGAQTITAAQTDLAGNTGHGYLDYTVLAWTLTGFYSPVDMNGIVNTVKNGSTVPLKFEVFAGSTKLTSTADIKGFKATQVTCNAFTDLAADAIEITSTGGTTLRYDSTSGQFIQNWQTPKNPNGCYVVTMTTEDGSSLNAYFKLK